MSSSTGTSSPSSKSAPDRAIERRADRFEIAEQRSAVASMASASSSAVFGRVDLVMKQRIASVAIVFVAITSVFAGRLHDDLGHSLEAPEERWDRRCEVDQQLIGPGVGFAMIDDTRRTDARRLAVDAVRQKPVIRYSHINASRSRLARDRRHARARVVRNSLVQATCEPAACLQIDVGQDVEVDARQIPSDLIQDVLEQQRHRPSGRPFRRSGRVRATGNVEVRPRELFGEAR